MATKQSVIAGVTRRQVIRGHEAARDKLIIQQREVAAKLKETRDKLKRARQK
jgi:hypothetical protein